MWPVARISGSPKGSGASPGSQSKYQPSAGYNAKWVDLSDDHSVPGSPMQSCMEGIPQVEWLSEAQLSQLLGQGEDRPTHKAARPPAGWVLVSMAQRYRP